MAKKKGIPLRERLNNIYRIWGRPLRGVDWRILLISLFVATIFWTFRKMNREQSTTLTLPITVSTPVGQQIFTKPPPNFVNVNVTGLGWNLLSKSITWFIEPLDVSIQNPGTTTSVSSVALLPLIRDHWGSLTINYIAADSIAFRMDSLISRRIHLRVDKESILLGKNFRIIRPIELTPDTVIARGPKEILTKLDTIYYISMDQEVFTNSFSGPIPVAISDNSLVQVNPDEVQVSLQVEEMVRVEREVGIRLFNFPQDTSKYDLRPNKGTISLWTEKSKADTITIRKPIILDYNSRSPEGFIYPTIQAEDSLKVKIVKPVRFFVEEEDLEEN